MKSSLRQGKRLWSSVLLAVAAAGAVRASDYATVVSQDEPLAYYRFNDALDRPGVQKNSGSIGTAGNAATDLGIVHSIPGALAGEGNRAAFFDFASRTEIPWNGAINPPNTQAFTMEAWFYPASDQTASGQSPVNNRYAPSGAQRQGWVIFQRKPDSDHNGNEAVGWNFRMYNENGGSAGLDITSLAPYELGKWTHLVVVYEPNNLVDASLTMYVNGVATNSVTWNGATPGYVANTNDHADQAASLALGNYNNTAGTSLNPYFGGIDEFAFYTNKLTAAQILAHYQNGTNASRATAYSTLIKSDKPVVYLRLDEAPAGDDIAVNMGDLRSSGVATHSAEVRHPASSSLPSEADDGSAAYHNRNGKSYTTMPWKAENNPDAGTPFSFEVWLKPGRDQQGGQCPVNNRWVGGTGRTGWVIFQRNPNLSYPSSEGHGWNFRMYSGAGSGGQDVLTDVDYNINEWSHLVVTWEPAVDNGDPAGNGNHQFSGTLSAYFNGKLADQQTRLYAANVETTETGSPAADLTIGSYNAASGIGNNAYEGGVDELAIYNNYVLTPDQILAHYQAGTNSHPATNYETLVLNAPFAGPERQGPKTYLRFNEPAHIPAVNAGKLGSFADGTLVLTTNNVAGPRPPVAGFDASNTALPLDGAKQWASLNNPAGLNIAGQITLEAWVQPAATQGEVARIISHGPPTVSDFLNVSPDGSVTNSSEVFLSIEGSGAQYVVGSAIFTNQVGTTRYTASAPVPAADLAGSAWVHLVGLYDGANWKLYRNGTEIATAAAPVGALTVTNGDWAIGSTGNGWADPFAGVIDEVAIYDHALTAAQVKAHATATGAPAGDIRLLSIAPAANGYTLTWSGGSGPYTIQRKSDLSDAKWTDVSSVTATTATVTQSGSKGFFRISTAAGASPLR